MTLITGNTYPVKDAIKALGGRWDAEAKGWKVPESKASEARRLVSGGSSSRSAAATATAKKCVVCGESGDRYHPIYRSGECQGCFEERKMGY